MTVLMQRALALSSLMVLSAPAFAQDDGYNPVPSEETPATSRAESRHVTTGGLSSETFAFSPQAGVYTYGTPNNGDQVRGVIGLGIDMNAVTAFSTPEDRGDAWSNIYIGPQTGFFFTHTGSQTSNFLGTSATSSDVYVGASLMYIPLDLKVGYAISDHFRISVHGGGNIIYQSVSGSVNIANATTFVGSSATASSWNIYPNVGGDLEWSVGKDISVLLRPDVTIASGTSPFAATVGVGFGLS